VPVPPCVVALIEGGTGVPRRSYAAVLIPLSDPRSGPRVGSVQRDKNWGLVAEGAACQGLLLGHRRPSCSGSPSALLKLSRQLAAAARGHFRLRLVAALAVAL